MSENQPPPSDIERFIAESYLYKVLDDAGKRAMLEAAELHKIKPGEVIIREGDAGDSFFIIKKGMVKVYLETPEGRKTLAELKEKAVVGEVAVLNDQLRTANVEAMTAGELLEFPRSFVIDCLKSNKKALRALSRIVELRMESTLRQLIDEEG